MRNTIFLPRVRQLVLRGIALFLASFIVSALIGSVTTDVSAHNFSPDFKWDYPNVTPNLEGRQTFPYTNILCNNAKPDLSNNTDLNFPTCSYSNTDQSDKAPGDILHFYGDYGHNRWIAFAHVWWWGASALECTSPATGQVTGNCNTSDKKSTFAFALWNTNGGEDFSALHLADHVTRHETIHAFGLSDFCDGTPGNPPSTPTVSIMRLGDCSPGYWALQNHDRTDLRNKYP